MKKEDKEQVVAELTERLRTSETMIVADYRGLTMPQIESLRTQLLEHGARFSVVKNTLGRIAAEAAGADQLLALLEGPSAVAFLETEGDPVAVAKAFTDAARTTRILTIKGGVMQGRSISAADVEELGKLPPADVLRAMVAGAILSPLYTIVGLFQAPLQNLVGLIDARIEQLEAGGDTSGQVPVSDTASDTAPDTASDAGPDTASDTASDAEGPGGQVESESEQPDARAEDPTESAEQAVLDTGSDDTEVESSREEQ